jgi:multiple sugar transport system substrate-binding protein
MPGINRRQLLAASGATGALALLGSCGDPSEAGGPTQPKPSGPLKWWDQFLPLESLHQQTFDTFAGSGGTKVEYTVYNPNEQGQALQLAFQSKQMPDVFTLAGVNSPVSALRQANWFSPLANPDPIVSRLPEGSIIEGLNSFEGKVYSWPQNSFRQYDTLPWANKELLDRAGIDPSAEATTQLQSWDAFRETVRTAQAKSGKPGLVLPIAFAPRMEVFVEQLAQVAGFPGFEGIELASGAYRYDHDAYVQAMEYLKSFQTDKLLLPASSTLDARDARLRWMAGEAVFFMDGPYNLGVIKGAKKEFLDQVTLWQIPTPNAEEPVITKGPATGTFWTSAGSGRTDVLGKLFELFVADEYRKGQAEAMDAAPIDLESVQASEAHPLYKQCCSWYASYGFLGPSAVARNIAVAGVTASAKPVEPDLAAIMQGVMSGDVEDIRGTLKTYSDALEQNRELAIKAKGNGKVSVDDWAFGDWQRGTDYSLS